MSWMPGPSGPSCDIAGGPAVLVMVTGTQGTFTDLLPFLKSGIGLDVRITPWLGVCALADYDVLLRDAISAHGFLALAEHVLPSMKTIRTGHSIRNISLISVLLAPLVFSACNNSSFYTALGNKVTAVKLSISPASTTVAVNGTVAFSATGGVPPYSFLLLSGPG